MYVINVCNNSLTTWHSIFEQNEKVFTSDILIVYTIL